MHSRVWLVCCAALLGACGSHGEFSFDRDGGARDAGAPRADAAAAADAGAAVLPSPADTTNGTESCATGSRYTVCGGVTEGGGETLPGGETWTGAVGGSHSITGTRFGIQGGHVVR